MDSTASDTDPQMWERQRGESAKAYSAFCIYRDAGAGRSIPAVAKECGKSSTLLYRWASRWTWTERAAAWDSELEREAMRNAVEEYREFSRRQIDLAMKLYNVADKAIDAIGQLSTKELIDLLRLSIDLERAGRERLIKELAAKLKAQAEKQAASSGGSSTERSDVIIYMPQIESEASCSLPDDGEDDDETIVCVPDNGLCPDVRPVPRTQVDNIIPT